MVPTTYQRVITAAGMVIVTATAGSIMGTMTQTTPARSTEYSEPAGLRVLTYRLQSSPYEGFYSIKYVKANAKNYRWFHVHTIERARREAQDDGLYGHDMVGRLRRFSKTTHADRRRTKRKLFVQSLRSL